MPKAQQPVPRSLVSYYILYEGTGPNVVTPPLGRILDGSDFGYRLGKQTVLKYQCSIILCTALATFSTEICLPAVPRAIGSYYADPKKRPIASSCRPIFSRSRRRAPALTLFSTKSELGATRCWPLPGVPTYLISSSKPLLV